MFHTKYRVATKCDDISCSEVIPALKLDDDPELEAIDDRIDDCTERATEWKQKEKEAKGAVKGIVELQFRVVCTHVIIDIEAQLKEIRSIIGDHRAHVNALEKGETFVSRLTTQKSSDGEKKRKRSRNGKSSSSKRRRISTNSDEEEVDIDDDDSFIVSDDDVSDYEMEGKDVSEKEGEDKDEDSTKSDTDSEDGEEDTAEKVLVPVTVDGLKAKIEESEAAVHAGRARLNEMRKAKKEAGDMLAKLKKEQSKVQKEKNAFCSLKRSEVCAQ
jgi:hypothetical protein